MLYYARGSKTDNITPDEVRAILSEVLGKLGKKNRVIALPPDFTRLNSYAGPITEMVYDYYGDALTDVMPALGTHSPMPEWQLREMFGHVPLDRFRVHDWRNDVVDVGEVPSEFVREVSEGKLDYSLKAQVNKLLLEPSVDLILSIGQVVPHEVIGMANYTKNIFVGVGGSDFINKSHYIGAVYGLERIMGRAMSPVRKVFEYAREHFISRLPIVYVLTVRAKNEETGQMELKGLFIGDDFECFQKASELSLETPRSRGVQEHLARQQERVPHEDGPCRRSRTHSRRSGAQGVRRGQDHRHSDSQVWLQGNSPYPRGHCGQQGQSHHVVFPINPLAQDFQQTGQPVLISHVHKPPYKKRR